MGEEFTIDLGVLGDVLPVAPPDPVTIEVPQEEDIKQAVEELVAGEGGLPTAEEIGLLVEEAVDEQTPDFAEGLFGPLDIEAESVEGAFEDIQAQLDRLDEIAEQIPDEPPEPDIEVPTPDLPDPLQGIGETIDSLEEDVGGVVETVEGLDVPSIDDIEAGVEAAVRGLLEDVPGGTILLDPDEFVDDQIDRLTDGLVSEEAREDLEDALEGR